MDTQEWPFETTHTFFLTQTHLQLLCAVRNMAETTMLAHLMILPHLCSPGPCDLDMRPTEGKPSPTVSQRKTSVQESELGKSAKSGGVTSTWSREQGGWLNGAKPLLKTDWPAPADPEDVACFSGLLGVGQTSATKGWAVCRSVHVQPRFTFGYLSLSLPLAGHLQQLSAAAPLGRRED